jgi:hypothetical protein
MNRGFRSQLRRLALYFLAYTLLGLFMFSQGALQKILQHDPNPWWHYLTSWMVGIGNTPTTRRIPLSMES